MGDLTVLWSGWVDNYPVPGKENVLSLRNVERVVVPHLQKAGFAAPVRRDVVECLEAGVGPITVSQGTSECTYPHFLNLVWLPLVRHIESIGEGGAPPWTEELQMNHKALMSEMMGLVSGPSATQSIDEFVKFIQDTLKDLVAIQVPLRLIRQEASSVFPQEMEPCPANALHFLRSSLCAKLVGPTLAKQVSLKILSEIVELPVPLMSDQDITRGLKVDLAATLEQLHCGPDNVQGTDEEFHRPAKRLRKDKTALADQVAAKTRQVLFAIRNRLPWRRVKEVVQTATNLVVDLSSPGPSGPAGAIQDPDAVEDLLVGRHALVKHTLLLDGAVDRWTSEQLFQLREQGLFAGVALATDESPPSQPRFRGLRFQITVAYLGRFAPRVAWEASSAPPIFCTSMLADLVHCSGKKGVDVSRVLEKQLARVNLNAFDVVCCTGDGGGENEGQHGNHSYFESINPGYVRRRCLPHISWRTCDQAVGASGLDYKKLAAYLVEGITWSRLRDIATQSPDSGGLGLFTDGSSACKEIFGSSPSAIIQNRPETDLKFLKFLRGKEHILHQLATKDLEQRSNLGVDTQQAVMHLGNISERIFRELLCELIERCMFLAYWSGAHPRVATETSWETLLERGCATILDLEITPEVLNRLSTSAEEVSEIDPPPRTWVELVVLRVVDDRALVEEHLAQALDFHRRVSDKAAAHLALLGDNTFRTPWLAAKLLSSSTDIAQAAAKSLSRHLVNTRPGNRTSFERHLFETPSLWENLVAFQEASPPVLLWHGHGQFEALFRFLAPRFLLSPDHVLDAERVHARWQWACHQKRSLKMHTLNSCLRLTHYLENNETFPKDVDLLPHLQAERTQHKVHLDAIEEAGEVALGWRSVNRMFITHLNHMTYKQEQ